jgi:hypothetical protein
MSAWHVDKNIHHENTEKNIPQCHIMCFCTMHASFSQCAKSNEVYVNCLNCVGVHICKEMKKLPEAFKTFVKHFLEVKKICV